MVDDAVKIYERRSIERGRKCNDQDRGDSERRYTLMKYLGN
jgi:hypothetical protein